MDQRIKYARTVLIILIAALLLYGYFHHVSDQTPISLVNTSVSVNAADLISLSDRNEAIFNKEYLNKVLSVRGIIRKIRKNSNKVTILLEGQPALPEVVSCHLDTLFTPASELQAGDSCTIQGSCAGRLKDVILLQCIIEK